MIYVLLSLALLGAFIGFVYSLRRYETLLLYHLVVRSVFDSANYYTYKPILASVTLGQILSFFYLLVFTVYLIAHKSRITSTLLLPIFFLILTSLVSSIFSGNISGFIVYATKWIYFYLIFLISYEMAKRNDYKALSVLIVASSAYPIINQMLLTVLIGPKCVPGQPICSYIGTFYHESELASWILLFIVGCSIGIAANKGKIKYLYIILISIGIASLFLNGYRTAILGFFVFSFYVYINYLKKTDIVLFAASISLFIITLAVLMLYSYSSIAVYFDDVFTFLQNPSQYFTFQGTVEKNELFSGRLYLFNLVLREYINSGLMEYFIGIGPDMVVNKIGAFSHNEFLSTFVELGILGFVLFIWFLERIWKLLRRTEGSILKATYICILVTALATMPFHDIRSIILLAIVVGIGRAKRKAYSYESKTTDTN